MRHEGLQHLAQSQFTGGPSLRGKDLQPMRIDKAQRSFRADGRIAGVDSCRDEDA